MDFSAAYSACAILLGDWNWTYKEEAEGVMRGESARKKISIITNRKGKAMKKINVGLSQA